ncbi:hypothetical protein AgCh_020790 [Apium graveolens]
MATLNFTLMTLRQPPEFAGYQNRQKPNTLDHRKRQLTITLATSSPQPVEEKPIIELEFIGGKLMNCGGGGSCGTCIVEVIDGKDLLSERTNAELKYLKKKPESWRLACQTIVGNKENSGKVVIQRLPQWKK